MSSLPPVAAVPSSARLARLGPVLCLGAGAVGSLVGARLHEAGVPVVLVGRGEHLQAVRRAGLTIDETELGGARRRVAVPAVDHVEEAVVSLSGTPAATVLAVKGYDVEAAARDLARLAPETVVLCLENGIGAEETVARYFRADRVVAGSFTLSVERARPGVLKVLTSRGGVTLAPFAVGAQLDGPAFIPLLGALRRAGFRLRFHRRADSVKWSKLLLNLWANATSAVFDAPPARVVADPQLFRLDWQAFREALRVMRAAGIPPVDLPGYPVRLLVLLARLLPREVFRRVLGHRVAGGRGGKMPSFWLDLAAGRRQSEVAFLNGAVVEAGRRLGVPTPVNQALTDALSALVAGRLPRDHYSSGTAFLDVPFVDMSAQPLDKR